ncbi:hypothetical protein [Photobacterium damselae]|uniref:hypothetical protein n=1 Tax=Photobacterium damselae TaxID=38293 RepID=UPI00083A8666|nr:hypothetical protein [Photobacterium damselae]ODA23405.1 hypothetical protein A0J46_17450 [Photobacterium damselae subsp. damselae]TLS69631.1 hypothetical protein FD718_11365 [Photobacterium damselae subsp. damselae]
MAITIRDIESHYYMIEELKSLTNTNVTTKALIKGGYLAVDIGKQLAKETERRKAVEEELEQLKQLLDDHIKAQSALFNYIKKEKP